MEYSLKYWNSKISKYFIFFTFYKFKFFKHFITFRNPLYLTWYISSLFSNILLFVYISNASSSNLPIIFLIWYHFSNVINCSGICFIFRLKFHFFHLRMKYSFSDTSKFLFIFGISDVFSSEALHLKIFFLNLFFNSFLFVLLMLSLPFTKMTF